VEPLRPGTHAFEVLAIEASGNQSITEGPSRSRRVDDDGAIVELGLGAARCYVDRKADRYLG
jgi:hypothetical protein